MQTIIIATVIPKVRKMIQAGEKFLVTLTEDTITLEKVKKLNGDELRKRREKFTDEQEEMSIEEICEIVREVRQKKPKYRYLDFSNNIG